LEFKGDERVVFCRTGVYQERRQEGEHGEDQARRRNACRGGVAFLKLEPKCLGKGVPIRPDQVHGGGERAIEPKDTRSSGSSRGESSSHTGGMEIQLGGVERYFFE